LLSTHVAQILCLLGKEPERLIDGCLLGLPDLELDERLHYVQAAFFLRDQITGQINKVA
jgi:hypothetical protein